MKARSHHASDRLSRSQDSQQAGRIVRAIKHLSKQELRQRTKRGGILIRDPQSESEAGSSQNATTSLRAVVERFDIKDPLFKDQWHLINTEYEDNMLNVVPVWDMGIKGKNVKISLIDDGLDYESDDLKANFVN